MDDPPSTPLWDDQTDQMDTKGVDDQELLKLPNTPTQTLLVLGFNFTILSDPLNLIPFFNQFPPEILGTRKRAMDSI